MLTRDYVRDMLSRFGSEVVSASRANFIRKNVTGRGSRSIDYNLQAFPNSFQLEFSMEDYMEYQDKGVSGKKQTYNTPYRYTNKMPPASAFDQWSIRRGLSGTRDAQGRFIARKSINYALARHIYNQGIKPSKFFTNAFNQAFRDLPDDIIEAYGLDAERLMETTLNANKRNA